MNWWEIEPAGGHETIKDEVVTCTRKEAHLQSLIENIARTKPGSMDFVGN